MISAAILRARDHGFLLHTLLVSSHFNSSVLSPPKNRSVQIHIRHMRNLLSIIYGRRVSNNRIALGQTPHPLCDSSNRRPPSGDFIPHREVNISNAILVTIALFPVDLYLLILVLLDYSRVQSIPEASSQALRQSFLHRSCHHLRYSQSTSSVRLLDRMADQKKASADQVQPGNPLDSIFNNKDCTMCKTHTIMINRLTKQVKELQEDYQADRNSKRKALDKRKAEIESLKERCSHLEAAMEHFRTLAQSYQAEASTKESVKNPEDSAT